MIRNISTCFALWAFGAVSSNPYEPGSPGAAWNDEEVAAIREKVLVLIDVNQQSEHLTLPPWEDQTQIPCFDEEYDANPDCGDLAGQRRPTEGKLMRLSFHDCFKYKDGTGGCDGCLNWKVGSYICFVSWWIKHLKQNGCK